MSSGGGSVSLQMRVEGSGSGYVHDDTGRGLSKSLGLRKGLSHAPTSRSASIPSRYQTFFVSDSETPGFSSQAPRFQYHLHINDSPGPGTYDGYSSCLEGGTEFISKAGTGGMASKTPRFRGRKEEGVGPASYSPLQPQHRHDFNSSPASSSFQKSVLTNTDVKVKAPSPSPFTYHPSHTHTLPNRLVTAQAAFNSLSKRSSLPATLSYPSPSHYHIQDSVLCSGTSCHVSVFTSKSQRWKTSTLLAPGPADYSPYPLSSDQKDFDSSTDKNTTTQHKRKHFLRFSAPALPLPPLPPSPGPGHYETQGPIETGKKRASGCVFVSTTNRWGSEVKSFHDEEPGPGSYNPVKPDRKSHLYNFHQKWI